MSMHLELEPKSENLQSSNDLKARSTGVVMRKMTDSSRVIALHIVRAIAVSSSLLLVASLSAQEKGEVTKVGTTAAQFLKIDVSPRGAAIGGAFVAIANDASALYWNVAGISRLGQNDVLFAHTNWIADIGFNYGAVVVSLDENNAVGASITSLTMGDMEVRTVDFPEGTGEKFSAGSFAAGVSYARNLTDAFSIGVTAKYINEHIWHMSASSFALDLGTLYRTGFHDFTIGMSISNFGTKMRYAGDDAIIYYNVNPGHFGSNQTVVADLRTDEWPIPLLFRVGVSMQPLKAEEHRLIVDVDALHPNDNTESLNVGAEYIFRDILFIRGGYRALFQQDRQGGLSLGVGVAYDIAGARLKADYAWNDFGVLQKVQRFSIGIQF